MGEVGRAERREPELPVAVDLRFLGEPDSSSERSFWMVDVELDATPVAEDQREGIWMDTRQVKCCFSAWRASVGYSARTVIVGRAISHSPPLSDPIRGLVGGLDVAALGPRRF